jgi:hypothetical protein
VLRVELEVLEVWHRAIALSNDCCWSTSSIQSRTTQLGSSRSVLQRRGWIEAFGLSWRRGLPRRSRVVRAVEGCDRASRHDWESLTRVVSVW